MLNTCLSEERGHCCGTHAPSSCCDKRTELPTRATCPMVSSVSLSQQLHLLDLCLTQLLRAPDRCYALVSCLPSSCVHKALRIEPKVDGRRDVLPVAKHSMCCAWLAPIAKLLDQNCSGWPSSSVGVMLATCYLMAPLLAITNFTSMVGL